MFFGVLQSWPAFTIFIFNHRFSRSSSFFIWFKLKLATKRYCTPMFRLSNYKRISGSDFVCMSAVIVPRWKLQGVFAVCRASQTSRKNKASRLSTASSFRITLVVWGWQGLHIQYLVCTTHYCTYKWHVWGLTLKEQAITHLKKKSASSNFKNVLCLFIDL